MPELVNTAVERFSILGARGQLITSQFHTSTQIAAMTGSCTKMRKYWEIRLGSSSALVMFPEHTTTRIPGIQHRVGISIYLKPTTPFMDFYDTMNDGYVPVLDLENEDLACLHRIVTVVGQEQQIPSIESWFHATTVSRF